MLSEECLTSHISDITAVSLSDGLKRVASSGTLPCSGTRTISL